MNNSKKIHKITYLALFTVLVAVFQWASLTVRTGVFATSALALMPIVLGAAICGPLAGAWLGFVFALVTFMDAAAFMAVDVFGTIVTVVLKGVLAGLVSGLLFSLLKKRNLTLATIVAALACPVTNSGIFFVGSVVFFLDAITEWATAAGFANVIAYILLGMIGTNFLIEFFACLILCPVILRLLQLLNKKRNLV
jgi:uncharacterized membrane protein